MNPQLFLNGSWYPMDYSPLTLVIAIIVTFFIEIGLMMYFWDEKRTRKQIALLIFVSNIASALMGYILKLVLG